MKKLVLIDGHALVHRAFHALPPTMATAKGVLTNAVFGFTSVLIKMIKDLRPDYIIATFDLAGPTFRHEEFAEYKSHRQRTPDELHAQIPLVQDVLTGFGIPIYVKPGFEADDVIGALAEKAKKNKDLQVIIMTGDLDTLQLVEDDKVVVFTLRKGVTDTVTYNEKEVFKRYGLKPSQLVDFKGLKGDPSDNIPGVPGVGEKTASALIQKFENLEKLYEAVDKFKPSKKKGVLTEKLVAKLKENKEMAFFSKKLATIITGVDLDFSLEKSKWLEFFDREKVQKTLQELGTYSLIKRLEEIKELSTQPALLEVEVQPSQDKENYLEITDKKEVLNIFNRIEKSRDFVFYMRDGLLYLTEDGKLSKGIDARLIRSNKELQSKFEEILRNPNIKKSSHDLKEIFKLSFTQASRMEGLYFDTRLAAYLLNSDIKDYYLDKIYFNEFERNFDPGRPDIEPKYFPLAIYELREAMLGRLNNEELIRVFEDIEIPLVSVLAEMELAGVRVDTKSLGEMANMLDKELGKLEKDIYKLCGGDFNINSPSQLSNILFEKLNLKSKKRTGKGAISTAAAELEKLVGEHPVIEHILKYREYQKLRTTYVEPFPNYVSKETSRLHTTFNQAGAATGRLSSQDPNIQNIPIRTELGQEFRKVFIAEKGFSLVSFDYSQIELRIAAHISGDEKMTAAFNRGEDIHARTAAEIFNVPPEKVKNNMRRQAKVLNFGILYGMGILGFQRASGTSRDKAKEFIQRYMEEFKGIAQYMSRMRSEAREKGYTETIFGRKRKLPEIYSGMPQLVAQAERIAINMPIQGTAADLIKKAMIKISDMIAKNFKNDEVRMLLQVHDELLFEIEKGKEKQISQKIKDIMERDYKLDVPVAVDVKFGNNWKDLKPL